MVKFDLVLASQVPANLPPEVWSVINDLYTQLSNLTTNLNNRYGVIQSPNGNYWRINVDNSGVVNTTSLGSYLP